MGYLGWLRGLFGRRASALALAVSISAAAHEVYAAPPDQGTVQQDAPTDRKLLSDERERLSVLRGQLGKLHLQGGELLKRYDNIFLERLSLATKKKEIGDKAAYFKIIDECLPLLEALVRDYKKHIDAHKKIQANALKEGIDLSRGIKSLEGLRESLQKLIVTLQEERKKG